MRDWKKIPSCYAITHRTTGRTYIGSSENPISRFWGHGENAFNKGDSYNDLYIDMRKDGITAFRWYILEQYDDEASMKDGELKHIAALVNAGKPIYNKRGINRFPQFHSDVANPYVDLSPCTPPQPARKASKSRNHLTPKQMALVVLLVEEGIQQWYIAEMFDVVQSTISKALLRMGARTKGKKK